jgi:hypothetical protein
MESMTLTKSGVARARRPQPRTPHQDRSQSKARSPQDTVLKGGRPRKRIAPHRDDLEDGSARSQESLNSFSVERSGVRFSLSKLFLIIGCVVGSLLLTVSALDIAVTIPFDRASALFDIGFLFSSAILLYLSWDARDACR